MPLENEPSESLEELKTFIDLRAQLALDPELKWDMSKYHIGNLYREHDRTTIEFHSRFIDAAENPDLPLYIMLFRAVNFLPSLTEIDCTQPFTETFIRDYCSYLDYWGSKSKVMRSVTSYITYQYKDSGTKLLQGLFIPVLNNKEHICGVMWKGFPADMLKLLKTAKYIGVIIASEIIQDLLYIRNNDMPFTEAVPSFYGTIALNYLKGRGPKASIPRDLFSAEVDEIGFRLSYDKEAIHLGRILHLFGKHFVMQGSGQIRYWPQRALLDTRPSYSLYVEGLKDANTN